MTAQAGTRLSGLPGGFSRDGADNLARHAYVGRFAPSPTGPLHFGSVLVAIGSWLDARAVGGRWTVRLDDLDTPRNVGGAATRILNELSRLGLPWDGTVLRQSDEGSRYQQALALLKQADATFACGCTRKNLVDGIYPGTCRNGLAAGTAARTTRLRVDNETITVDDLVHGPYRQDLQAALGDFVLVRADGIVAYHLATVIDDAAAGVTHIVRGTDLLASTPRQIALQRALGLPTPRYAHLPIATNADGHKLSKQTYAAATEGYAVARLWCEALQFLGYGETASMLTAKLKEIQDWALSHWSLSRVPAASSPVPADFLQRAPNEHG
jgi:glutamyl-Q tRNA(Asp) synthetase